MSYPVFSAGVLNLETKNKVLGSWDCQISHKPLTAKEWKFIRSHAGLPHNNPSVYLTIFDADARIDGQLNLAKQFSVVSTGKLIEFDAPTVTHKIWTKSRNNSRRQNLVIVVEYGDVYFS